MMKLLMTKIWTLEMKSIKKDPLTPMLWILAMNVSENADILNNFIKFKFNK
jgi:hypothetical protein